MTTANVRYIANGYIVNSQGQNLVPAQLYAGTIPEVVYWLGKVFEPYAPAAGATSNRAQPKSVENTDPLLNQEAVVSSVESGGFLVRQNPNFTIPGANKVIDTYCVSLDAVSDQLTLIFTPPPPDPPVVP